MSEYSLEQLEQMEKLGFIMVGETFKDTLAYVQIQRMKQKYKEEIL